MIEYILAAILAWSPVHLHRFQESPDVYKTRAASIADDIAKVVNDEPPIFEGDENKAKTATLVTAIAFFESNFMKNVDEGRCQRWECDGGLAFSLWQIHPEEGIVLLPGGWTRGFNMPASWRDEHGEDLIDGKALIADRQVAARVALHMLKQSWDRAKNLCGYTGEEGPCPKADLRLSFARRWWASHSL